MLEPYGVPLVPSQVARSAADAVGAAEALGYPVVMKADAPGVAHKLAAGRVRHFATERLYQQFDEALDETTGSAPGEARLPFTLTAIPYFLWGNRNPGPMRVWIPVAP